jgi:HD-GYP domain-containing protein (c-di-GMP phosphodiesterase class II)
MSFDITSDSEKNFSKNDLKSIKSFQRLMNSLYENNYSSNKRQNFKNGIVMSLIKTLELYDQYTGGHSEHVANISKELATKLHLTEKEIGEIYWAGVVHDIGKVGIDSSIINKKGKLTEEEYEIVKKHSSHGAAILDESDDLRDIAEIVKHHHEWWNGKGYPDGLIGDDIPFSSQILTVADAVSAMMDKRPYSRAKTKSEIIEEIAKNSGIMFNPKIAVLMIELLKGGIVDKIKKAQ